MESVEFLVTKAALEGPAQRGVANHFEIGCKLIWILQRSSDRLVAEVFLDEVDAFGMKLAAIEPAVAIAFVSQAEHGVGENALEGIVVPSPRIIHFG